MKKYIAFECRPQMEIIENNILFLVYIVSEMYYELSVRNLKKDIFKTPKMGQIID